MSSLIRHLLLTAAYFVSATALSASASAASAITPTQPELAQQAAELMSKACQRDDFSGAVLIAKHEQVIFQSACGEASKRYHVANNLDTRFNIASLGKMFTAVAIAQLAERGLIDYQAKVSTYLGDDWLNRETAEKITVADLLSHRSGLSEFLSEQRTRQNSREYYRELADMKKFVQDKKTEFTPGSRYLYSNSNYHLLGAIIEQVSQENYFDYIRRHIYQVAGMQYSDSYALDEPVENLAMGYLSTNPRKESTFVGLLRGSAFGCGYSTVGDLLLFAQALQEGKLLKPASLTQMWQRHAPEGNPDELGYGYGFQLRQNAAGLAVGHSGGWPGFTAQFWHYRETGYTYILLSNYHDKLSLHWALDSLLNQPVSKPGQH